MSKLIAVRVFVFLALLAVVFGGLLGGQAVLADQDDARSAISAPKQAPAGERLELYTAYPTLHNLSGETFSYEIDLIYEGAEAKTFEVSATPLQRWTVTIKSLYRRMDITQIRLQPGKKPPVVVSVILEPLKGELPEPGDYITTLTVSLGDVKASIDLKAVVTDLHRFTLSTESGRLNADMAAGKENHVTAQVTNTGTTTVDKIAVVTGKPEYWVVKLDPERIENLAPGSTQKVDIVVIPPEETIAGDYSISVGAFSSRYGAPFELRATILTPPLWRAVGVLLVLMVVVGVAVMYQRLGQR